ncbi:hypothetical protein [Kitasatospora sp. NPDC088346]|uniref:hypothetical protein n=1 Tax=Kitasatospora sp. NPDC088346 TaxID=3364073 RepID=UPI003830DB0A
MPRLVRALLLWLLCTAFAVTAVFLSIGFVIDSTADVPPTVHAGSQQLGPGPAGSAVGSAESGVPDATVSAEPSPAASSSQPAVTAGAGAPATRTPAATASTGRTKPATTPPTGTPTGDRSGGCPGGPGVYTVKSTGGQVSVRYGESAVCLISAVPAPGFTTQTSQGDSRTLQVTFTSAGHRSQITSTVTPRAQSSVRETAL